MTLKDATVSVAASPTAMIAVRSTPETVELSTPPPTVQDAEPMLPTPTALPTPQPTAEPTTQSLAGPIDPAPDCVRLTDFATEAENSTWFVVNDNVMGGRSNGGPSFAEGAMVFEGDINTNGGGFSSIRVQLAPGAFDGYTRLRFRARTDGRPYKVTLEDGLETRDRRVSLQAPLAFTGAQVDGWQVADVEFATLNPRIFGRDVASDPFRPDLADQLGIMLSDNLDGPFRIEVDWIDICR